LATWLGIGKSILKIENLQAIQSLPKNKKHWRDASGTRAEEYAMMASAYLPKEAKS
jgi:hypothetical protein